MHATGINLNRLAVFAAVVRAGSFTAAAAQLGMTKSMASQHLARLEKELGVSLLLRTTRRMVLTEAGAAFHADCEKLLADAEAAIRRIGADRATPSGTLRVTAAGDYGPAVIAPALASFARRFPQLRVELVATDRIADPIAERFDVAIRAGWLRDSSLRATRLAAFRQRLVASPAYLAERGTPRRPEDLAPHRWVELTALSSPLRWTFAAPDGSRRTVRVRAAFQANSTLAVRAFVLEGAGLSVLPDYLADEDVRAGRLVHVLARHRLPDGGIHAVYPDRRPPAKVRAFIDHLREVMPRTD
jgi:DNA-binding transcriptional LysR family regulator